MPYKRKGLEVVNKKTGKSMGKSKTVEKAKAHMRALYAATAEEDAQTPKKITQKDILAQVRKTMPPPQKVFNKSDKTKYSRNKFKSFKDYYNSN